MADDKKKPAAAAPEKYDPTVGMSKTELFFAGMGKAVYDTGRFFGNLVGVVSDKEIEEAKRLDEALMKHDAAKAGVAAGYVATSVGGVGAARGVAAAAVKVGVTASRAVRTGAVVGAMEAAEKGVDVTLKHVAKGTAKVAASAAKEAAGTAAKASAKAAAKAAPVVAGVAATAAAAGYAALDAEQNKQQLTDADRETITSVGADAKVIDAKLERENNAEMMTNVAGATAATWGVAKTVGWGLSKLTGPVGRVAYAVVNVATKTAGFGAVTAGSAAASEALSDGAAAAVEQTGASMHGAEAAVAAAGVATVGAAAAVPKVRSKVVERVADVAKNFKSAGWVGKLVAAGGVALSVYNVAAPVVELEEGVEKRLAENREVQKIAAAANAGAAPTQVAAAPAEPEAVVPAAPVEEVKPQAAPPKVVAKPAVQRPQHTHVATAPVAARPPEAFNPMAEAPAVPDADLGFRFPEGSFERFELAAPATPATSYDSFGTPVPVGSVAATQAVPPATVMAGDPYHTGAEDKVELGQLRESLQEEPQKMALNTVTSRPPSQNMA